MAITTTISQAELARLAAAAYEDLPYRICLANNGASGLTANSSVAAWDGVELSGNGYARVTGTIGDGAWDPTDLRYEMPQIVAEFQASGGTLTYDTVYTVICTASSWKRLPFRWWMAPASFTASPWRPMIDEHANQRRGRRSASP